MKTGHFFNRERRLDRSFTWERTWHTDRGIRFAHYIMWRDTQHGTAYNSVLVSHAAERRLVANMLRQCRRDLAILIAKGPPW